MTAPVPLLVAAIGATEVFFILLALLLPIALLVGFALLVSWWIKRNNRPPPEIPSPAPPAPNTSQARAPICPKCGQPKPANAPQRLCPRCVFATGLETAAEPERPPHPKAMPVATELTSHFPHLEIIEPLGQGGMGWVYKARQVSLDRNVALKILPPRVATDPAFAQRFQREARALARLAHPNIVTIYDFGHAGPYFYFLMEYVDGATLRELQQTRTFSFDETLRIIHEICKALQFAHEAGVIHLDIKPENILLDSKGKVKISDFGIAKLSDAPSGVFPTENHRPLGTPNYMAPEQLAPPHRVDHRADLFSLGVVFYELLTGQLPIGHFELPSQLLSMDARIDDIVVKSLAQRPERRYASADAVKSDIERLITPPIPPSK